MNNKELAESHELLKKAKDWAEDDLRQFEAEYTNAKLYKLTLFVTDVNNSYGDANAIIDMMECSDLLVHPATTEVRDVFWHDGIDINSSSATTEQYEAYFE